MARLERVERDSRDFKRVLRQLTDVMVDLNDRVDGLSQRVDTLGSSLSGRIDELRDSLGSRLDRLIAVTIQERTYSVERLADIERRLSKLEERSGV
jgi:hypothetical protein